MTYRSLTTACLWAVLVPTFAAAQGPTRVGSWEFSLGGGGVLVDSKLMGFLASGPPESRFAKNSDPKRFAPAAVARLGYNVGRHLGLSISGEAAMAEGVTYYTPGVSLTLTGSIDARTSPFLILGSEVTRIEGENDRRTHSLWGAHAGFGFRHMMTNHMGLRADVRAKYAQYTEVPMEARGTITPLATLGFTWFSGGRRTPDAIVAAPIRGATRVDTVRTVVRDTIRTVRVDTVAGLDADQVVLRVQFRTDGSELLPISYPVLNTVATAIKATPNSRWMVEGHTDSVGTAEYNHTLSHARARTVMDYLISQGVERVILESTGFGYDRPVFSNSTEAGRAENRRVQLRRIPPPPTERVR